MMRFPIYWLTNYFYEQAPQPKPRRLPGRRWRINRLIGTLAALVLIGLLITTILGHWLRWTWIELLWRWLELLIIPVVLGAGALWFNNESRKSEQELALRARESEQELAQRERDNDRQIAEDRVQEEALQRYLGTMQELILDYKLRRSEKDAEIRTVARARTLAVLRSLDGNRRGQVVKFLYEAGLIRRESSGEWLETIIDLRGADLPEVDLRGADLGDAKLCGANLDLAYLACANLTGAEGCTNEQLAQAESLKCATKPDGTVMTREADEEFRNR